MFVLVPELGINVASVVSNVRVRLSAFIDLIFNPVAIRSPGSPVLVLPEKSSPR